MIGDVEVEEAAEYLYQNGLPAYLNEAKQR